MVPGVGGSSPLGRPIFSHFDARSTGHSTTMTTPWGLPDFDAHEEIHFVTDEKCGLQGDHRRPFDPSRPGRRRLPLLALCQGRGGADRCAAAVARDELQERDGRPSARRRQVGDPGRRGPHQDARHAPRVRQGGRPSRRPLRHRRGRRHERRRHDRGRAARPSSSPACPIAAATSAAIPARTPRSACSSASRPR